jgi:malate dehydrogenase (oxaloacetate-decarboxylating)
MPLARQRAVILGAGAVGIGIARALRDSLRRAGVTGDDLFRAITVVDVAGGLALNGQPLEAYQAPFAWPTSLVTASGLDVHAGLATVVRALRPTVLVGVCGQTGAFGQAAIRAMADAVERPVIMPLSNPTSQSEATPADLMAWTGGRALVATGSPLAPVAFGGRTSRVGQGNNAFISPGIGLGVLVAQARMVSEGMFRIAAEALADQVSGDDLSADALFPPVQRLRRVATGIAAAVVREARDTGLGRALADNAIADAVSAAQWDPCYPTLKSA